MTQEQIEERLTIAGFQLTHYFQDSHNAEYEERHYRKKIEGSSERIFLVKAWDGLTEEIELHIKSEFDSNEKRQMLLDVLGEPTGSCPYDKGRSKGPGRMTLRLEYAHPARLRPD